MNEILDYVIPALFLGIGATFIMDIYSLIMRKCGFKSLDYTLLGRWIGYFRNGKFFHSTIMSSKPVKGEKIIGWTAHYLIGIAFAGILLLVCGNEWIYQPGIVPPLMVGIFTTAVPYFMMQPAFGFGVAASNTPNPKGARLGTLFVHVVYGLGLYISALLFSII